jgi:predicted 2-oxoglutarate/Fe(II)-dependent dioxygenase YbiX
MIYKIEKLFTEDEAFNIILKHDRACVNKALLNDGEYISKIRETNVKFLENNAHVNIQFAKYTKGDHFDWHKDYNQIQTIVVLLNDDFEGGEFEVKDHKTIHLKTGDCVMIPSLVSHRVKPITKGVRYSLTMWHS